MARMCPEGGLSEVQPKTGNREVKEFNHLCAPEESQAPGKFSGL